MPRTPSRSPSLLRDGIVGSALALGGSALLAASVAHLVAPLAAYVPNASSANPIRTLAAERAPSRAVARATPRPTPPPGAAHRSALGSPARATHVAGGQTRAPHRAPDRSARAPLASPPRPALPSSLRRALVRHALPSRALARHVPVPPHAGPHRSRARPRADTMPAPPIGFDLRPKLTEAPSIATATADLAGIRIRGRTLPAYDDGAGP